MHDDGIRIRLGKLCSIHRPRCADDARYISALSMTCPRFLCADARHERHKPHIDHDGRGRPPALRRGGDHPIFCIGLLVYDVQRPEPSSTRSERPSRAQYITQTAAASALKRHPQQHKSRARSLTVTLLLTAATEPATGTRQLHTRPLSRPEQAKQLAVSPPECMRIE